MTWLPPQYVKRQVLKFKLGTFITPPQEGLFILISKSTMAFLTGQSWHMLKSWYTVGGQV